MTSMPYSPTVELNMDGKKYRARLCLIAFGENAVNKAPKRVKSPEILARLCEKFHEKQIVDIGMDLFDRDYT